MKKLIHHISFFSRLKWLMLLWFSCLITLYTHAQPFSTINLRDLKPEPYKNKILRSEKTTPYKLNPFSLFFQNTYSHYNFFFNAQEQMKEMLLEAEKAKKDNYLKLISFYPYDINRIASSPYLDRVIEKTNSGILLHDLRSKWVEELYFLMGNAYFFKKHYDTAAIIYQYINYAFAPSDNGYHIPIGSNISHATAFFSMMTPEQKKKFLLPSTHLPRRNDAFIWQIRNLIDSGNYIQANSYIQLLRGDSLLSNRLKPYVQEVTAYYFYQQKQYDSAATYYEQCVDKIGNKRQQARRYFLLAQLFHQTDSLQKALKYYQKASKKTFNPEMQAAVEWLSSEILQNTDNEGIHNRINHLKKLAKKEKYFDSRGLFYLTIAQMYKQIQLPEKERTYLMLCIKNSQQKPIIKSKAFYQLASLDYREQQYISSIKQYDSIVSPIQFSVTDSLDFIQRKPIYDEAATSIHSIEKIDSLLHLIALPEKEKMTFLTQEAKRIRKLVADKEDSEMPLPNNLLPKENSSSNSINEDNAGNWYFNSPILKAKGYAEFLRKFGKRTNQDNWIRKTTTDNNLEQITDTIVGEKKTITIDSAYVTAQDLLDQLPQSTKEISIIKDSLARLYIHIGTMFQNKMADFPVAKHFFELAKAQSNNQTIQKEIVYNLYQTALFDKNATAADTLKQQLIAFNDTLYNNKITFKIPPQIASSSIKDSATMAYNVVYELFLKGNFKEALSNKKQLDEQYGHFYWTPQLLFIESIYYAHHRQDSIAIAKLNTIINNQAFASMHHKATLLKDKLNNRIAIENYLTKLVINEPLSPSREQVIEKELEAIKKLKHTRWRPLILKEMPLMIKHTPAYVIPNIMRQHNRQRIQLLQQSLQVLYQQDSIYYASYNSIDSSKLTLPKNLIIPNLSTDSSQYVTATRTNYYVVIILQKVNSIYLAEVGNAFEKYHATSLENEGLAIVHQPIDDTYHLLKIGPFENVTQHNQYLEDILNHAESVILPWLDKSYYTIRSIPKILLDKVVTEKEIKEFLKL